jgi:hypothetical protein
MKVMSVTLVAALVLASACSLSHAAAAFEPFQREQT